jgi:uncharacterized protein YbjT (DUF2867 family)
MKILAVGGTGTVGSQVIQQLVKRGTDVRALVRNKEYAGKLPKEVEPVIGDLLAGCGKTRVDLCDRHRHQRVRRF